jgi:WD40 repeat protein
MLAAVALALLADAAPAGAQDRRGRRTPGLVLETGARTALCDVLTFSPSGDTLMAAGDDKVVRLWRVGADRFLNHRSRTLRWPIYREQRGGIFAMALSPDVQRVAVGGFGFIDGYMAVLNLQTGDIEHALERPAGTLARPGSREVIWSAAYSPDSKHIVYGTEKGEILRWDVAAGAKTAVRFNPPSKDANRVRLVAFLDGTRFLSVAMDGLVRLWDLHRPGSPVQELTKLRHNKVFRAVLSPDHRWLAALSEGTDKQGKPLPVELLDVPQLLAGRPARREIPFPQTPNSASFPRAVAFDPAGQRLAVGAHQVIALKETADPFNRSSGGFVHVFSVPGGEVLTRQGPLQVGYRPEQIAFRPGNSNQVATAGGNNHEVRLWDLRKVAEPLDEIRSPGSCLWGVRLSKDNKYLAWQEEPSKKPEHPNRLGGGEWRVLNLRTRKIENAPPRDFVPVQPINTLGGWRVQTTEDGWEWRILGPGGTDVALTKKSGLYLPDVNQIPRCYTFLPAREDKPVRLALGHMWGISLYELRPNDVRLARLMVGHETYVMSVAPSADGKLLVSASLDQTLAGWSLEDWPSQAEMGARFVASRDGRSVEVRSVDAGSPAWEAGLTEGDEIVMVISTERSGKESFLYDPEKRGLKHGLKYGYVWNPKDPEICDTAAVLKKLNAAEPAREHIFLWRHGKEEKRPSLTTVRQRPLWRFFPFNSTRGDDYVIWRWRDFYYDTPSARADQVVGWQVNAGETNITPAFYPLDRFRSTDPEGGGAGKKKGFYRPDKIWPFITEAFQKPEKVIFPDIEPPLVDVRVVTKPDKDNDLELEVRIRPTDRTNTNPQQRISRVVVWLDDVRLPLALKPDRLGVIDRKVKIDRKYLLFGANRITVQCYNEAGGRGQKEVLDSDRKPIEYLAGIKADRDLYALCVGINDYSKAKGDRPENLYCSEPDAREMARVLKQHEGSILYKKSTVEWIPQDRATATEILKRLGELRRKVRREDWLVLFLSGHGNAERNDSNEPVPGSFYYVCADHDSKKPSTKLTSRQLYEVLAEIPCRKLVILDTCHSGDVAVNPLRDLMRDGVPFLVFSSCSASQSSLEPKPGSKLPPGIGKHGLFTQCLLDTLEDSEQAAKKKRSRPVTARDLAVAVRSGVPLLIKRLNLKGPEYDQTPVFLAAQDDPEDLPPPLFVLCKP